MPETAQLSIVQGELEPALFEHTIGEALQRAIAKWPKQEALVSVHQGGRWTYEEFGWRVDQFAAGLLAVGLKPGDRVGIWAPNCAEWTLVQFATARIGLILVNINPAYRLSEVEYTLKKVGVKALVCAEKFKSSDYVGMISELAPEIPKCMPGDLKAARLPDLKILIQIGSRAAPGWFAFEGIPSLGTGKLAKLTPSTSSLPRGRRGCRRGRRCRTGTSSTTPTSSAWGWG
jgi:fatty-acyl-CoA synthase